MSKSRRRGLFGRRREEPEDNLAEAAFSDDWLPSEDLEADDDDVLERLRHSDAMRPLKITPEEERFPPLAPEGVPVEPARPRQPMPRKRVYEPIKWGTNFFTLLVLMAMCGLIWVFSMIWQDPYVSLNPFPPPTRYIEITVTPEVGMGLVDATLPAATATSEATPTAEIVDTANNATGAAFALVGDIAYQANTGTQGCDWSSMTGTVQASDGEPVNGYRVLVDSGTEEQVVFTGSADHIGPGGWELVLSNTLISGQYTVQLTSSTGTAVSDVLLVELPGDCSANVAVINWQQAG
ncbi:hypothetical protein G4Y79_07530 [Phototrophicus methaneseepsis]|uniref:Uncharacterized protein n=1 Tax=Phototrophicus methaneseepsis TaxID=2710758 RepID=A0A7S8EC97_9CHLR|nr:hypothetical protein [Phototrophicus methaneseepsis]QPC84214.1 hypothetical protein G4Y79_07530 [Phototrophicus methaneseepsis]